MTTKITISLPDEQVDQARAAVATGRARSVSAYIADAVDARLRSTALEDVLKLLGPPTPEATAWAKEVVAGL